MCLRWTRLRTSARERPRPRPRARFNRGIGMAEPQLTEIEVEDGERKIKVCRNPAPVIAAAAPAAAAPALSAPPMPGHEDVGQPEDVGGHAVKSPMVGTAFLSPEPGAAPFIAV